MYALLLCLSTNGRALWLRRTMSDGQRLPRSDNHPGAGVTVFAMMSVSADTPQPTLLVCIHHLSPVISARFVGSTKPTWEGTSRHRCPNMRPASRKADNLPP
jgi:hypothetical protein